MIANLLQDAFWAVVSVLTFVGAWLVRNVLTNGKRLTILETESKMRTELMREVRDDVKDLQKRVK